MVKARNFRVILFTAIIAAALFSGVCATGYAASPLLDGNITLTKTGSPATFSEVGQVIEYTYVLEHTSGYYLYGISITDNLIDNVTCPETEFSSGTITCTGQYIITEEDIVAAKVTNKATVTGYYNTRSESCCSCGNNETYSASANDSFTV
ncbi:MAG: hypothetical protein HN916_08875 [Anaerolineae bacterium]|jgi:hypothetical protein|nr:hypothetical protein [Anaerolineae bacterium]